MEENIVLSNKVINVLAEKLAKLINQYYSKAIFLTFSNGGLPTCYALATNGLKFIPTVFSFDPKEESSISITGWLVHKIYEIYQHESSPIVIIDDILDTGVTIQNFETKFELVFPTFFLVDKQGEHRKYTPRTVYSGLEIQTNRWVDFPWGDTKKKNNF